MYVDVDQNGVLVHQAVPCTALCSVCIPSPFTLQLTDRGLNQCRVSRQRRLPMGDMSAAVLTLLSFNVQ